MSLGECVSVNAFGVAMQNERARIGQNGGGGGSDTCSNSLIFTRRDRDDRDRDGRHASYSFRVLAHRQLAGRDGFRELENVQEKGNSVVEEMGQTATTSKRKSVKRENRIRKERMFINSYIISYY